MSTPDANGWMPIESAPKDGEEVLVAFGWFDGPCPLVMAWRPKIGWHIPCTDLKVADTPTHWQALPKPPVSQ